MENNALMGSDDRPGKAYCFKETTLFWLIDKEGVFIAEFNKGITISKTHIELAIGKVDEFAKTQPYPIPVLLDFSAITHIEDDALSFLQNIEARINSRWKRPRFAAISVVIGEDYLSKLGY